MIIVEWPITNRYMYVINIMVVTNGNVGCTCSFEYIVLVTWSWSNAICFFFHSINSGSNWRHDGGMNRTEEHYFVNMIMVFYCCSPRLYVATKVRDRDFNQFCLIVLLRCSISCWAAGENALIDPAVLANRSCTFRNIEPNLVSFHGDLRITEEDVVFPAGTELVSRLPLAQRPSFSGIARVPL